METKANYIVTGAFTLAVIFGVFGFVYWVQNSGGSGDRSAYRVVFVGSVSGLHAGSHGFVQRHAGRRSDHARARCRTIRARSMR